MNVEMLLINDSVLKRTVVVGVVVVVVRTVELIEAKVITESISKGFK